MTYPPGSSGFPPPQQPPGSYGSPPPSFGRTEQGPANVTLYSSVAVMLLGLAAYLTSFGPMYDIDSPLGNFSVGGSWTSTAALLAALLAGVGVLPKAKNYTPIVAVIAVLGALLAISNLFDKPGQASVGWGLWSVLAFTILQAIVAVGALLLDVGVVAAPTPKPKYAPYGFTPGAPGGYYGQPGGYPPYGGYSPGFGAPAPGGFSAGAPSGGQSGGQHAASTPPTGFPAFGQSAAGSGSTGSGPQESSGGQEQPGSSTPPPGPAQS